MDGGFSTSFRAGFSKDHSFQIPTCERANTVIRYRSTVTSDLTPPNDLEIALALADAADLITIARFRAQDLQVETKPDLTPVSDADRSVEEEIRRLLAPLRPTDSVLGEEFGATPKTGERQWVIDPIDGTKNFVRGLPVWATLIALMEGDTPTVGVVSAPALGRRWYASRGSGAFLIEGDQPPRKISVSAVTSVADASLSYSDYRGWADAGLHEQFLALGAAVWRSRAYGDFWSHMLVAEGAVDIAIEPELSLWDMAALDIILREAGGEFSNTSGTPGVLGGSGVSTNSALHGEVIAHLTK
jgi:histidinol-phosphatase